MIIHIKKKFQIDLDDDTPMKNGNEQIDNIDEIIGVSNNNTNNNEEDGELPNKKAEETTLHEDEDDDMGSEKANRNVKNNSSLTEERPAISLIPITKDSTKTKPAVDESENKPEVELINADDVILKQPQTAN